LIWCKWVFVLIPFVRVSVMDVAPLRSYKEERRYLEK